MAIHQRIHSNNSHITSPDGGPVFVPDHNPFGPHICSTLFIQMDSTDRFMIKLWWNSYSKLHLYWPPSKLVSFIKGKPFEICTFDHKQTSTASTLSLILYFSARSTEYDRREGSHIWCGSYIRSMIAKKISSDLICTTWAQQHQGLFCFCITVIFIFPFVLKCVDSWTWQHFFTHFN